MASNHKDIKDNVCKKLSEEVYPFYEYDKKDDKWVEKTQAFVKFLTDNNLIEGWKRTDKGGYSKGKDTLADNEHIHEILEFRRVKELLGQIKSFNKIQEEDAWEVVGETEDFENSPNTEGKENIFAHIGSDNRLRCWFNPYGTQTSRNAPPSTNFIFAMSSWIRSAVQPPEGYAITGIDYSSEEFIIAACESGDKAMKSVYATGDVYLGFAKLADKRIPTNATKETHKRERNLFKATVLGMQFGMGIKKLHAKLMSDMRDKSIPEEEAKRLYEAHKDTFEKYWEYMQEVEYKYRDGIPLKTRDGWYLYGDNVNMRSATNFPIQGAGGAILRRAVKLCQDAGLSIISPLHDAIYFIHRTENVEREVGLAKQLMNQAFRDFYGCDIGMSADTWYPGAYHIEDKGQKYFHLLSKYFMSDKELIEWENAKTWF